MTISGDSSSHRLVRFSGVLFYLGALTYLIALLVTSGPDIDLAQDYSASVACQHGWSMYGENIRDLMLDIGAAPNRRIDHPPFVALFFRPLTLLSFRYAGIAFGLIQILVLHLIVIASAKELDLESKYKFWFLGASLIWYPTMYSIGVGQLSILVAALLFSSWHAAERGNAYLSGLFCGIAALLKIFPVYFLFYFILTKRWGSLLSSLVTIALGMLLVCSVCGYAEISRFFVDVAPRNFLEFSGSNPTNLSLPGLWAKLFGEHAGWANGVPSSRVVLALTLISQLIVLYLLYRSSKIVVGKSRESFRLYGITLIAMILSSPISWAHLFVILIPALILLFVEEQCASDNIGGVILVTSIVLLSLPGDILSVRMLEHFGPAKVPLVGVPLFSYPALGLVMLWWRLLGSSTKVAYLE